MPNATPTRGQKTKLTIAAWPSLALVAWTFPTALAAAEPAPAGVPVPAGLQALHGGLLGFGTNPMVDDCNTQPVDQALISLGIVETWEGRGIDGKWTGGAHDGERLTAEMLERAI